MVLVEVERRQRDSQQERLDEAPALPGLPDVVTLKVRGQIDVIFSDHVDQLAQRVVLRMNPNLLRIPGFRLVRRWRDFRFDLDARRITLEVLLAHPVICSGELHHSSVECLPRDDAEPQRDGAGGNPCFGTSNCRWMRRDSSPGTVYR